MDRRQQDHQHRRGGLYLDINSSTLIRNSNVIGNRTEGPNGLGGGGILLKSGAFLAVESSLIAGNTTSLSGGGLHVSGTLVVRNSTIAGNSGASGGAMLLDGTLGGTLTVENSTISGNSARFDGGGIWMKQSTATIRNSTIAFNTADSDNNGNGTERGGGLFVFNPPEIPPSTVTLQGTIVAENRRGTAGPRDDVFASVSPTSGNNLIGVDTGMTGVMNGNNGNLVGTAAAPLNPMLGPLDFHGGTTLTHALLPGCPAINAGFNFVGLGADQRGGSFSRSVGTTDIGAFEVQPPPPPPPPTPPTPPPQPVVEVMVKRVRGRTRVDVLVDGAMRKRFFPFKAFTGRVQVQRVDVSGDGLLDVVARATVNGKKRTRTFTT